MKPKNQNLSLDVLYHLDNLKSDFARQQIENNKNQLLVYAMNDFINKIELVKQIVLTYDNHNFKLLTNKINSVLQIDPELHCVNITIQKIKFLSQIDHSKTALIIHQI